MGTSWISRKGVNPGKGGGWSRKGGGGYDPPYQLWWKERSGMSWVFLFLMWVFGVGKSGHIRVEVHRECMAVKCVKLFLTLRWICSKVLIGKRQSLSAEFMLHCNILRFKEKLAANKMTAWKHVFGLYFINLFNVVHYAKVGHIYLHI